MRFRRALIVLALGLITLTLALVTQREMYYRLTYLLFAILLASAMWAWTSLQGLRLRRYTRVQRAQVGRVMEEQLAVRNASWLPKLFVVVRDQSSLPGHHASRVVHSLGRDQEFAWRVRTLCEQRGEFRLGPVTISGNGPLGLFERRREFTQTSRLVVYPAVLPVGNLPPPRGPLPGGDALRRRTHYVTPNAAGVRDYVPGDSFSRIHWASTARKNRLIVKEFELDPMSNVWVFLDMERSVQAALAEDEARPAGREKPLWRRVQEFRLPPSTEEYAVAAAASVANAFIRQQYAVGLVAYGQGREVIQADRGRRQQIRLLETLAILHAEGAMPFSHVLQADGSRLARGTTVVAITASTRKDWVESALYLHDRGLRILAILVDAASFGGPAGATALESRLLTVGIPTITLRESVPLAESLNGLSASPQASAPARA
ncbi:MAG: DUF58 domain-containing protein [Anaerolineae bacterium]